MRRSLFLSLAALLALGGCDEAAAPEGRAGDVTARVYIDRDASGSLTAADSLLAGVSVSLVENGETRATETTDASGTVTFEGVAPGSYQLSVAGNMPAGTALVTNPTPSAVVNFQGGDVTVDFRLVFFPGSISGRLYREDNNTPGYQQGADTPAPGLWVYLHLDSAGAMGRVIDSVQTDAQGAYVFPRVAPGRYVLRFEQPSTIQYVNGGTASVTVSPNQETSGDATNATFTGSLVITIAEARARPTGSQVAVVGNVTVPPNVFTSGTGGANSEIWIQDATGGIAVFAVPSSSTYQLGDRLQVVGSTSAFNGQLQIGSPVVTVLSGNTVVQPQTITVPQARALTGFEGELVEVNNLTVTDVPSGTGAAFTVTAISSAGDTLQIRVAGANTGLSRTSFVVGNRYNVTGILTQFRGTAQLKPRFASDVELGQAVMPIGTARTQAAGTQVTVVGTVSAPPGRFTSGTDGVNSEIWVQDASGGIAVFPVATADSALFRIGEVVEVTGTISIFNGQVQIGSPAVTRLRTGTEPVPLVQTGTQINALTEEGELVTLPSFTVTTVGGGTSNAFTVTGTALDGATVQVRIVGPTTAQNNTGLTRSDFAVGSTYRITGILTQFRGTAQLKPRSRSDVTTVTR